MKTQSQIFAWLRANLGPRSLGGLTSQDAQALLASVTITPLISWSGADPKLFEAYKAIVEQMQPNQRWLAFHAVAIELDWSHRAMIWGQAGILDWLPGSFQECKFGPRGSAQAV